MEGEVATCPEGGGYHHSQRHPQKGPNIPRGAGATGSLKAAEPSWSEILTTSDVPRGGIGVAAAPARRSSLWIKAEETHHRWDPTLTGKIKRQIQSKINVACFWKKKPPFVSCLLCFFWGGGVGGVHHGRWGVDNNAFLQNPD